MVQRAGRTSVPQIFIDGHHVGGSDDLITTDESGELNRLLGADAVA
jgi:glutaredoxin 3